ncbi:uncharacterized protein TRIREDRAFT_103660 [Trichoderma reesei QM6a]|uniref:Predicted protein n=1 Tax=Hypocrea jecorina (strain QM6a) TaxID=431241 RepID=G0RB09_HYPJQ|nr:uncharacterized protein TRIREDRAFT_103660 [Trichoderma reesei QM6a]EGR51949.1 predicted protein [Trichoderma reesei QM6a]
MVVAPAAGRVRLRLFHLGWTVFVGGEKAEQQFALPRAASGSRPSAAATLPESFVRHPGPTEYDQVIELRILVDGAQAASNKPASRSSKQLHAVSESSRHAHVRAKQLAVMCWHDKKGHGYGPLHASHDTFNIAVEPIEPLLAELGVATLQVIDDQNRVDVLPLCSTVRIALPSPFQ